MNLPNRITIARAAAVPVIVVLMYIPSIAAQWWAAALFVAASLTDLADGYIARTQNLVTDFGKFADPIADKLLITASMVVLVGKGHMAAWVVVAFVSREFIISAYRLAAASRGVVIAADKLGKYKTLAQTIAVPMLTLLKPVEQSAINWGAAGAAASDIVTYVALALSVASCINYIYANRKTFVEEQ
jgi:CDP-diacylglycerol--glycerol-3-phosphate 3-phosphatidyltransferase